MSDDLPLGVPDPAALRRRVLVVGALSLMLFLAIAYTIAWLGVSDAWLLICMLGVYLLVIRPMMRPVREAIALRRRLAYRAWLDDQNGAP